jgi:hypothetical protein
VFNQKKAKALSLFYKVKTDYLIKLKKDAKKKERGIIRLVIQYIKEQTLGSLKNTYKLI